MAINEQPPEKALQETADWKARDQQAALQRARVEIQSLRREQKDLVAEIADLQKALDQSQRDQASGHSALSSVQQQLALYMAALEETRRGSDLEEIRSVLQGVMKDPTAEQALKERLAQAEDEHHGLQLAFERCQAELASLHQELRAKDELIEDKEREVFSIYGELDLTKSLLLETRQGAEGSDRLRQQHQRTLELLRGKEAAVATLEIELQGLLNENQQLLETHRRQIHELEADNQALRQRLQTATTAPAAGGKEVEALKETILLLEDQISDLEIVNSDLYSRLAAMEADTA